jgi:hypothetical protein
LEGALRDAEQAEADAKKPDAVESKARNLGMKQFLEQTSQSDKYLKSEEEFRVKQSKANPNFDARDLDSVTYPLDQIANGLSAKLKDLKTEEDIKQVVDAAAKAFWSEFEGMERELAKKVDGATAARKKMVEFDKVSGEVQLSLDLLRLTGSKELADFEKEYGDHKKASLSPSLSEADVENLIKELRLLKGTIDREKSERIANAEKVFKEHRAALANARKILAAFEKSSIDKTLRELTAKAVKADLDMAEKVLNGPDKDEGNVDAANAAGHIIEEANGYLAKAGDDKSPLKGIADKLTEIEGWFKDAQYKLSPEDERTEIKKEHDKLKSNGPGGNLEGYEKSVTELHEDAKALHDLGKKIEGWRTDAKVRLVSLKVAYKDFEADFVKNFKAKFGKDKITPPTGIFVKKYSGALKGDWEALENGLSAKLTSSDFTEVTTGKWENRKWEEQAKAFKEKLDKMWKNNALVDTAVVADVEERMNHEKDVSETRESYVALKTLFKEKKKKISKTESGADEFKLLEKQVGSVGDMIPSDLPGAKRQMKQIRERLDILSNTEGLKLNYKGNLKAAADDWATEAAKLGDHVDALIGRIEAACDGTEFEEKVGAIKALIEPVSKLFDADAFRGPVEVMIDEKANVADKREAREQALKTVLLYQDRMMSHALAHALAANPFDVDIFGALYQRLNPLHLELSRYRI